MSYGSLGNAKRKKILISNEDFITHTILEDDTLPGIAVRYQIPEAALMRCNNLWNRKDIYGRKTILIPKDWASYQEKAHSAPEGLHSNSRTPKNDGEEECVIL
eukprot:TRINITY_DN454_c0_g1_i1.p1 TRINITY_DN454_c0_g1~~TRINITY_DN454_c0_g1_i1.p1  ORF type:complete len:103 (+),score=3.29 TRINITY_DN454_c0_g1_i1:52-360(+)